MFWALKTPEAPPMPEAPHQQVREVPLLRIPERPEQFDGCELRIGRFGDLIVRKADGGTDLVTIAAADLPAVAAWLSRQI